MRRQIVLLCGVAIFVTSLWSAAAVEATPDAMNERVVKAITEQKGKVNDSENKEVLSKLLVLLKEDR